MASGVGQAAAAPASTPPREQPPPPRSKSSSSSFSGAATNNSPRPIMPHQKSNSSIVRRGGVGLTRSPSSSSIPRSPAPPSSNPASSAPPPLPSSLTSPSSDDPAPAADDATAPPTTAAAPPAPPPGGGNADDVGDDDDARGDVPPDYGTPSRSRRRRTSNSGDVDGIRRRRDLPLPRPLPPRECPLLCAFYAEFDIVVGPRVCYQSPRGFMHLDVDVGIDDVHCMLEETFRAVMPEEGEGGKEERKEEEKEGGREGDGGMKAPPGDAVPKTTARGENDGDEDCNKSENNASGNGIEKKQQQQSNNGRDASSRLLDPGEYWNWSPNRAAPPAGRKTTTTTSPLERQVSDGSGRPSHVRKRSGFSAADGSEESPPPGSSNHGGAAIDASSAARRAQHGRHPSSLSSPRGTAASSSTNQPGPEGGDNSTIDTELPQNSIFAATSEYIITGNELANRTVTVSTHGMHILSRPTIIEDTRRYERNSLLFAVGFVLRRSADPRPFWPVLSNLSSTLRDMEVESEFLSSASTRHRVQIVLEDVLASLNSGIGRCNLFLDDANLLGLRLFRPPPPPVSPVPDHAVPILLRPEWQLQAYDWDLTINWIIPHIDGCMHVRQIAASTEVDMDMVRACLRVLRHHGVLAHVDVFRYCNVYERFGPFPPVAGGEGRKEAGEDDDGGGGGDGLGWLEEAFWYSARADRVRRLAPRVHRGGVGVAWMEGNSPNYCANNMAMRLYSHMSSVQGLDLSVSHSSAAQWPVRRRFTSEGSDASPRSLPRSFPTRAEIPGFIREERSHDEDDCPGKGGADGDQVVADPSQIKEMNMMKKALAQIYSSCSRSETFGEMLLGKIEDQMNEASISRTDDEAGKDDASIDWKLAFEYFDHRRLVTFGVVKGFLRRVHQFPLAYAIEADNDEASTNASRRKESIASNDAGSDNHEDDSSNNSSERRFSVVAEEAAVAARKMTMDEMSVSLSYSPLIQGIVHPSLVKRGEMLSTKKEIHLRSKMRLLGRIALAMDGTRCDDELSCMFERPIEKLIEMLLATGRWDVISVFSCTD